ncbi:MAG: hypothetical protein ACHREM_07820 [Polyangiales bacterium]
MTESDRRAQRGGKVFAALIAASIHVALIAGIVRARGREQVSVEPASIDISAVLEELPARGSTADLASGPTSLARAASDVIATPPSTFEHAPTPPPSLPISADRDPSSVSATPSTMNTATPATTATSDVAPRASVSAGTDDVAVARGTPEGDPMLAERVGLYRAQLDAWFSARFPIRGKI